MLHQNPGVMYTSHQKSAACMAAARSALCSEDTREDPARRGCPHNVYPPRGGDLVWSRGISKNRQSDQA